MGLFDKKICDNCGGKIGLLGNRKLEDGNICKDCAAKLSPWFSDRKKSTLAEIQQQLRYREENSAAHSQFHATARLGGLRSGDYTVYVDGSQQKFFVTNDANYIKENPDIISFSQVTGCSLDIDEDKDEITFTSPDGERQSYVPPRYEIYYNFWITINVNTPYFNQIKFKLNSSRAAANNGEAINYQNAANQIVSTFGGSASNGMNMGMNNMNMGMNGTNMGMNSGMGAGLAAGVMGAVNTIASMQAGSTMAGNLNNMAAGMNVAMNGMNTGMNNMNMGMNNMNTGMNQSVNSTGNMRAAIKCSKCGWEPEDLSSVPKFCPNCGDPFNSDDRNY